MSPSLPTLVFLLLAISRTILPHPNYYPLVGYLEVTLSPRS